jgi:hypothetical protein
MTITCKICNKEMNASRLISHLKFKHYNYTIDKYIKEFGEFRPKVLKKTQALNNKQNITCQLCNSQETINSFRSHLRWKHPEYNSEKYIKEFGEFRPKQLRYKNNHKFNCGICDKPIMHNRQLMYHITKSHPEVTQSEYIIKYLNNNENQLCKCGCNQKEEIELVNYIKSIYNGEIQTSVKNIIEKYEIDIYLPELKIGIEYNGLYWHSEKGGRFKDYHLDKLKKSQQAGIRLIQIFSDEWINKNEIVRSKIKNILNLNINKIYARKCEIKEIDSKIKNKFLNTNHIQGTCHSNIRLGLYYNNDIVAVMTFQKPRIAIGRTKNNIEESYELVRYASSVGVVGGASKLLKYFIQTYKPKHIYSYSDNRWTDPNNNMYLKLGFIFAKTSPPNYFYTKDFMSRLHRYNFNKFHLKKQGEDISKTEKEIMTNKKYTRVWDCGNTRYELTV